MADKRWLVINADGTLNAQIVTHGDPPSATGDNPDGLDEIEVERHGDLQNEDWVGGTWLRHDQALWNELRAERDRRLAETDWTQLPDQPDERRAAWAPYRQTLRDIPAMTADPAAPDWPTPPEGTDNGG